jgi:hypothetical protein
VQPIDATCGARGLRIDACPAATFDERPLPILVIERGRRRATDCGTPHAAMFAPACVASGPRETAL